MITMPAFFGDPSKQAALLELLRVLNKAGVSGIFRSKAVKLDASELGALHEMSGFPASLLTVIDQIMKALSPDEAHQFGIDAVCGAKRGVNVADVGWRLVEAALTLGVAREGEGFVDANRMARKLGHDQIQIEDPRVVALMSASTRGGEANAGVVVKWVIGRSYDPEPTARNFAKILIKLMEAT
jgi:hypothetical protein